MERTVVISLWSWNPNSLWRCEVFHHRSVDETVDWDSWKVKSCAGVWIWRQNSPRMLSEDTKDGRLWHDLVGICSAISGEKPSHPCDIWHWKWFRLTFWFIFRSVYDMNSEPHMTFSLVCMEQIGLHLGLWVHSFAHALAVFRWCLHDPHPWKWWNEDLKLSGCEQHRPAALRLPAFIPQSIMSMGAAHRNSLSLRNVSTKITEFSTTCCISWDFFQKSFASPISIKCFSLKQTSSPMKINGWKMIHFLLGQTCC